MFDKTGTLTLPEPRVANAAAIDPDLLQMAARLALSSRHPLAVALAREARRRAQPYDGAIEEPGQGVRAMHRRRRGAARQRGILRRRRRHRARDRAGPQSHDCCSAHGERATATSFVGRSRRCVRMRVDVGAARCAALGLDLQILSGDRADAVAPVARGARHRALAGRREAGRQGRRSSKRSRRKAAAC